MSASETEIRNELRRFIEAEAVVDFAEDGFTDQSDLFEEQVFDSLMMVKLTTFLEETYGVVATPDAIMDGALASVEGAARYVIAAKAA